jgi:hypothetical protein
MTLGSNISNYNWKTVALLGAPTYRRLPKDHTEAVEWNTTLLLKKSSLPCECGQVSIRQTSHSIKTRVKKHQRHVHHSTASTWATAFNSRTPPSSPPSLEYMDWMIRKAIKIELHPNYMKREDGFLLSQS